MTAKEWNQLTSTEKGRNELKVELEVGMNTRFWQILALLMEDEKIMLQNKINDLDTPIADLQELRIKLHYVSRSLGMPTTLVENLSKSGELNPDDESSKVY